MQGLERQEQEYIFGAGWQLGLQPAKTSGPSVEVRHRAVSEANEVLVQFVHTPKCGGMAFKRHLKRLDGRKAIRQFPRDFRIPSSHGAVHAVIGSRLIMPILQVVQS